MRTGKDEAGNILLVIGINHDTIRDHTEREYRGKTVENKLKEHQHLESGYV